MPRLTPPSWGLDRERTASDHFTHAGDGGTGSPTSGKEAMGVGPLPRVLYLEDESAAVRTVGRLVRGRIELVAVGTIAAGIEALRRRSFDGVIADVGVPDGNGLELLEHAYLADASTPLLVLSGSYVPEYINRACKCGALYAVKPAMSQLEAFIRLTIERLDPEMALARRFAVTRPLTPRQVEILCFAIKGMTRDEIAAELGLSSDTVKSEVALILRATGQESLRALVIWIRDGAR